MRSRLDRSVRLPSTSLHVLQDAKPAQPFADHVRAGGAAHHADDCDSPWIEQQLRKIRAILARHAGYESCGQSKCPYRMRSADLLSCARTSLRTARCRLRPNSSPTGLRSMSGGCVPGFSIRWTVPSGRYTLSFSRTMISSPSRVTMAVPLTTTQCSARWKVLLQGEFVARRDDDALDLEAVALDQAFVEAPRAIDAVMGHRLMPAGLAQALDDLVLTSCDTLPVHGQDGVFEVTTTTARPSGRRRRSGCRRCGRSNALAPSSSTSPMATLPAGSFSPSSHNAFQEPTSDQPMIGGDDGDALRALGDGVVEADIRAGGEGGSVLQADEVEVVGGALDRAAGGGQHVRGEELQSPRSSSRR